MSRAWKHISTYPRGREILVCGGEIESELYSPEPVTSAVKVMVERPGKFDVVDTCGYSVWVNNPTHWCDLPEAIRPSVQEFDL